MATVCPILLAAIFTQGLPRTRRWLEFGSLILGSRGRQGKALTLKQVRNARGVGVDSGPTFKFVRVE